MLLLLDNLAYSKFKFKKETSGLLCFQSLKFKDSLKLTNGYLIKSICQNILHQKILNALKYSNEALLLAK
jgi:hypothetical protein